MSDANSTAEPVSTNPPQPPASKPDPAPQDDDVQGEQIPKSSYDRLKQDLFKAKEKAKEYEKKLEDQKLQALKSSQNWEEIAKLKEQEAETYKNKFENFSKAYVESKKQEAVRVEALRNGIDQRSLEDLELLDFTELTVETTSTGKILVSGADRAIGNLKLKRPHWFSAKPATVNPASPEARPPIDGKITIKEVNDAEVAWKKNPNQQTKKVYEEMIYKFKAQR